jgi:hypothetical protein
LSLRDPNWVAFLIKTFNCKIVISQTTPSGTVRSKAYQRRAQNRGRVHFPPMKRSDRS